MESSNLRVNLIIGKSVVLPYPGIYTPHFIHDPVSTRETHPDITHISTQLSLLVYMLAYLLSHSDPPSFAKITADTNADCLKPPRSINSRCQSLQATNHDTSARSTLLRLQLRVGATRPWETSDTPSNRVLVDSREGHGEVVWARWDYIRDRWVSNSTCLRFFLLLTFFYCSSDRDASYSSRIRLHFSYGTART